MYPKVKVRVQKEEDDQYAYEKTSLPSLKAYGWLPHQRFSSSDESPESVARIPRSYVPLSPPPNFRYSKDTNKNKPVGVEDQKTERSASAPRPRAVLSSPVNDGLMGSRTPARIEQLSRTKDYSYSAQNRHAQCKIFPKSTAADKFSLKGGDKKDATEVKSSTKAKPVDSSIKTRLWKKIAPSSAQKRRQTEGE